MIKKYIEFAIENGYDAFIIKASYNRSGYMSRWEFEEFSPTDESFYTPIITSKPFIEAITRGVIKNNVELNNYYYYNEDWCYLNLWEEDIITIKQSIAIRDNKLEEFITNLL